MLSIFQKYWCINVDIDVSPNTRRAGPKLTKCCYSVQLRWLKACNSLQEDEEFPRVWSHWWWHVEWPPFHLVYRRKCRSGTPLVFTNRQITTRQLAEKVHISKRTIHMVIVKQPQNAKHDKRIEDFSQRFAWFVKQVFHVSCFVLFCKEGWFLYKMSKEFCEILSRQKEICAKCEKCVESILFSFRVRSIIFCEMTAKCPQNTISV